MISVFLKTYGCLANVADSEVLGRYLADLGCTIVEQEIDADLILVNTCAIREKAEQRLFSYIGRLAMCKKERPYLKVGIIGCVASYRKEEFVRRFDYVQFSFGAKEDPKGLRSFLAKMVINLENEKQLKGSCLDISDKTGLAVNKKKQIRFGKTAYLFSRRDNKTLNRSVVNVMTGCNNYCTYCIVPFVRGRELSFPSKGILERVQDDIAKGAKEINLLGQNVNAYICPETGITFAELLKKVALLEGEFWIRFLSPHPEDMSEELLVVMAEYKEKIGQWIHLPIQSGSDRILERMKRKYTAGQFLETIASIRKHLPDATISTDIIIGFPGETKEDYEETREVIDRVPFDFSYSFIFSPRKYTKAATFEDQCSEEEKLARLIELQERQKTISRAQNEKKVGTTQRVLVENTMKSGNLFSKTSGNVQVTILSNDESLVNEFVQVRITDARATHLIGELL
jgi:tRNA-2-methylthio-N6-dimethylallyladenosine synthase